jgi:membrane protease YdiL (CAAX protease family)
MPPTTEVFPLFGAITLIVVAFAALPVWLRPGFLILAGLGMVWGILFVYRRNSKRQ